MTTWIDSLDQPGGGFPVHGRPQRGSFRSRALALRGAGAPEDMADLNSASTDLESRENGRLAVSRGTDHTRRRAPRLSREQRRAQLLDVAADLLVRQGAQAVTMERLAEWAGVSKALPYSHFDNSNAVLLALRNRENRRLAERLWQVAATAAVGGRTAAVTAAFFDAVENSSDLLGVLTGPGAIVAGPDEARQREGAEFVVRLLETHFSMTHQRATAVGPVLLGAFIGAADGWGGGDMDRHTAEHLVLSVFRTLLVADP